MKNQFHGCPPFVLFRRTDWLLTYCRKFQPALIFLVILQTLHISLIVIPAIFIILKQVPIPIKNTEILNMSRMHLLDDLWPNVFVFFNIFIVPICWDLNNIGKPHHIIFSYSILA